MPVKKKKNKTTPVESVKHRDKRANIPTEELRDFVKEDENHPKTDHVKTIENRVPWSVVPCPESRKASERDLY